MAGPYYVDSNATGSNDGTSKTNAWTSWWTNNPTLAAGEIVYYAHNHEEGNVAAAKTLTGPTAGEPAYLYSINFSTDVYTPGAQLKTTGGAYQLLVTNAVNAYGIVFESGATTTSAMSLTGGASDKEPQHIDCTYKTGSSGTVVVTQMRRLINPTRDLTNDSSGASNAVWRIATGYRQLEIIGGSVINATNRTGSTAKYLQNSEDDAIGQIVISGHDLSALPSACEILDAGAASSGNISFNNCKLPSTYTVPSTAIAGSMHFEFWQCQNGENDRLGMDIYELCGTIKDSITAGASTVYLTGTNGAVVDDGNGSTQAFSWVMASSAYCFKDKPLYSPWIYLWNDTTGTRNFDLYVGAGETLDDKEVWAECEYLGTTGSEQFSLATTKAGPVTAAATITTTGGTWNATVTEEYYLRNTVTVNEKGLVRVRAGVGGTSKTIYINPKIIAS